jgi:two-component system phosphate regulon sensor histidine kinase PhoR
VSAAAQGLGRVLASERSGGERVVTRSQLILMSVISGLVILVVAVSGSLAERSLREREMANIAQSLEARALLVRALARSLRFEPGQRAALDEIADLAHAAAGARVTLIDAQGAVVGDSDVSVAKLATVENHADRPEVRAALAGEVGSSTRSSSTVGRPLLYLAIPDAAGDGVVRLAVDVSEVDRAVAELRRALIFAGTVGIAAAIGISFGLSWFTLRPLREMRRAAVSIAGGDLGSRLSARSIDELGGISTAINQMAEQIRERIDETTHEKEQLQAVLNGMVEGVLVVDAAGRVLLVNDRLCEFYRTPNAVEGRSVLEVVRDAEVESLLREAAGTDQPVSRKVTVGHSDQRVFRVHAVRFPSGGGPRTGTVAVFHDITEVSRLEAIRRDFVSNASHELRTPVTAIRGYAETLLDATELAAEDRNAALETIHRHAIRLSNLVTDLLDLSKIEGRPGDNGADPIRLDAAEVAAALVRDSQERVSTRGLELEIEVGAPAWIRARRQDVEQTLTNLIDNACSYTDEGGRIRVSVASEGNFVVVRVADTGIGISPGDQRRIFERFYRVDASRSRALGGTGLGLSIVKHLVHSMGGTIDVESRLGVGSTFTVRLPVASEVG